MRMTPALRRWQHPANPAQAQPEQKLRCCRSQGAAPAPPWHGSALQQPGVTGVLRGGSRGAPPPHCFSSPKTRGMQTPSVASASCQGPGDCPPVTFKFSRTFNPKHTSDLSICCRSYLSGSPRAAWALPQARGSVCPCQDQPGQGTAAFAAQEQPRAPGLAKGANEEQLPHGSSSSFGGKRDWASAQCLS